MKIALLAFVALASFGGVAQAKDVSVNGYYRHDGTYVQPYVRSAPDSDKSNNYGPSRGSTFSGYGAIGTTTQPQSRDSDHDGIPNYRDRDDDNDGVTDSVDKSQYGSSRSGYSSDGQ